MRLYLSSFRAGDHPERLLQMLGDGGPAAVIANAMDAEDEVIRHRTVQNEFLLLRGLGLDAEEIDLRDYFEERERLASDLSGRRLVWVRGGNTFMLRHAMARSGADAVLTSLLRQDALVYGGYSAGSCVLAPSLRGVELADDPEAVRAAYGEPAIWDGLGVLDHAIVPHYQSPDNPDAAAAELAVQRHRDDGVAYQALRDGQVLVVDGASVEVR